MRCPGSAAAALMLFAALAPAGGQSFTFVEDCRDGAVQGSRASATGELTWLEAIDHFFFCDFDVLFGFETYAVPSPDGERMFITSGASAITEFSRDAVTGGVTFADAECLFDDLTLGINLPRKPSLDSAGAHLYVPGQADDAVAAFDTYGIFTDGFESGDPSKWSSAGP